MAETLQNHEVIGNLAELISELRQSAPQNPVHRALFDNALVLMETIAEKHPDSLSIVDKLDPVNKGVQLAWDGVFQPRIFDEAREVQFVVPRIIISRRRTGEPYLALMYDTKKFPGELNDAYYTTKNQQGFVFSNYTIGRCSLSDTEIRDLGWWLDEVRQMIA